MEEIALSSWIFPTLPATNPTVNWPLSLHDLYLRVRDLKHITLWKEPFDESFIFQDAANLFIEKSLKSSEEAKANNLEEALITTLSIALNSGSYERIVKT
jgi:hypothetical protein